MLTRQKVLLSLLKKSKEPLHTIILVKLSFLLSQEIKDFCNSTFYDFLPYKYGPFSFALYRELESLKNYGYITWENDLLYLSQNNIGLSNEKISNLNFSQEKAIKDVFTKYGNLGKDELIERVYEKHPWYAQNSLLKKLKTNQIIEDNTVPPSVYTIGYQGMSVDSFFAKLIKIGIKLIADVRNNPVSRKYGFASSSLRGIAEKLNINYINIPNLGIPSVKRKNLEDVYIREKLFAEYETEILPQFKTEIKNLICVFKEIPSVLVCAEKDHLTCHRFILASRMSEESGLPIIHLTSENNGKAQSPDNGKNLSNTLFEI